MTGMIINAPDVSISRMLGHAKETIDIACLSLVWPSKRVNDDWPLTLRAIALAPTLKKRVRLLLPAPRKSAPATLQNARTAMQARSYGIESRLYYGHELLHAKLIIIDNRICLCGSANMTTAALTRNHEAVAVVDDADAVLRSVRWYSWMWGQSLD